MFKALILCLALTSCANYQFGDITRSVIELKQNYCTEEKASERAIILFSIHLIDPAWVPACTVVDVLINGH